MNVRFVTLSWRRDRPWINRKLRCVNLRFDWAVLESGKPQISLF